MSLVDLYSLFKKLPSAVATGEFQAIPLSNCRKDFIAKNSDGAPVFLLHDSSAAKYNPSINFRHLSAQFQVTCRVQTGVAELDGQFCLVSCDAAESDLHELFIRCVGAAVEEIPVNAGTRELESCILQLRDLFRALALPTGREVSGLWAELFVISKCGNPALALGLWHEDKFDRFDFSSGTIRLEVKSSVRGLRAHEFAMEQLEPPSGGMGFVASVLMQPLTGGVTLLDLARGIEASIIGNLNLKQKLWKNVTMALGADFSDKLDRRFDTTFAEKSLMVFAMSDIPTLLSPLDPRITAIRFVSDLTSVLPSLSAEPWTALEQIFAGKPESNSAF